MLPNLLEKGLEKNGGQILYRHTVDEILMKDSTVYGVKLSDGTKIYADRIVSNATIWNLYGKLIKPELITPERMKWAQNFEPTAAAAIAYMTVKKEAIPESATSIEAFISDLTVMEKNNYFVYIPSVDDPSICPADMHSISILCSAGDYKWPRPWEPEYQSEEYEQQKAIILENAMKAIEGHFPNFRENIVSVDMASPSTTERFTLRNYGVIGGPKQAMGQHLMNRLKSRTEFKNLYAVGDSCVMGEGVTSVTTSAIGAANMVLEDLKMPTYNIKTKPVKNNVNYVKGQPRTPTPDISVPVSSSNAKRLAVNCQWCEDPKCMIKCPAGIDVLNFVRRIEGGNIEGAARVIRENNPLGEICGILCPAEKLCESVCNRLEYADQPVRIKDLQKYACEQAGDRGWDPSQSDLNGKKVAIVGAGPAGISCAYYLARFGFEIDLYEKEDKVGGLISQAIPAYRVTDTNIQSELQRMITNPRIHLHLGESLGEEVKLDELSKNYHAVFLALGLSNGKELKMNGLDKVKSTDALSFLKKIRKNPDSEKLDNVLIVGGGSVAADAAITALKSGAKSVKIVSLESKEEMPCLSKEVLELEELGIEILNSWGPTEILDLPTGGKLVCNQCTAVCDDKGNFSPTMDNSVKNEIEFTNIIFAVGQQISPEVSAYLESVIPESFTNGRITADPNTLLIQGSQNIYLGGDLYHGGSTIVQAVADGRKIAIEILNSVKN
ncbi:MAG: FAD-dependent oxidoreductase [Methanosarcinaceae archaeon]|nr:FAD-dependent oxidoreductase [Methanosarcinaceae archaeon]